MATLTLTIAANGGDRTRHRDTDNTSPMPVGGVGTSGSNVGYGDGWRFVSVTLTSADTVTSAALKLMKSGNDNSTVSTRITCTDEDNRGANWSASSPNRPGDPAIQSGSIVDESAAHNRTSGTVYDFPAANQATLGAAIEATVNRSGWASGNALGIVINSDQDASAYETFARQSYHDFESATASSEPQLVITYTPAEVGQPTMRRFGMVPYARDVLGMEGLSVA